MGYLSLLPFSTKGLFEELQNNWGLRGRGGLDYKH